MNVLVIGGGVIGVTTAYYLNRAGHEVTVIDRASQLAMETSFANGGQVSWSAAHPWAAPGIVATALKWLLKPHSPLVLRPRLDPALWLWLARMVMNCTPERYAVNKERMLRLARYSHACLVELREATGLHYDAQTRGTLWLLRTAQQLDNAARDTHLLDRLHLPYRVLDRAGCVTQEPALAAVAQKMEGGIHFPGDESGDCRAFTLGLAEIAARNGARFVTGATVTAFATSGDRIQRVVTDRGEFTAAACVLAAGVWSPLLARTIGLRLPIYPVKGYSLTMPIDNPGAAPLGTLTDETYKVVLTRLGNRLRAAGTAELAGYDQRLHPKRLATLAHVVRDLFPGAGDIAKAEPWTGLRPMTPDNPPLLGATSYRNLFLNTGHGTLGWTMACGSGHVLADLISGRTPEIDLSGLTLDRYA